MNERQLTKASKRLSYILRHVPESVGLTLMDGGWVSVDDLLSATGMTLNELEEIVAKDNKKRYEFDGPGGSGNLIRASQGHSIKVDLCYEAADPPEFLYHGTSRNFLESIMANGLLKMERHDVHMFADKDFAWGIAKGRRPNPVVLEISAQRMALDGYTFKLSSNEVWLTETVPSKYLKVLSF